jgi:hypothetical protein
MASVDLATYAGATSSASSVSKAASASAWTVSGAELAAARVTWGGTAAKRAHVPWLPAAHTPITLDGKTLNPVWFRAFHEIFENRLGGVNAKTVPQVVTEQAQTQTQVLQVQTQSAQVAVAIGDIASTVNTATQVAQNNDLSGSDQIPRLPNYKQLPLLP